MSEPMETTQNVDERLAEFRGMLTDLTGNDSQSVPLTVGNLRFLLDQLKADRGKVRDLARDMARVAHWLLNDRGWTRAMAARDLANTARKAWPVEPEILGDAASLVVGDPHE